MNADHERIEALISLGRHRDAAPLLAAALAADPSDTRLQALLAVNHLALDENKQALAAAERLIVLDPTEEWGHRLRSSALRNLERYDEARASALEAVRLDPQSWQAHIVLAQACVFVRKGLLEAQAAADRAVALNPEQPDSHFVVGIVAQQRMWDDQAAAAFKRTLALDPEHSAALAALTALEGGGVRRTADGFGRALRQDPQNPLALDHVDALARRFVRTLHIAALLTLLLGASVISSRERAGEEVSAGVGSLLIASLLVGGAVLYAMSVARQVPDGIRRYLTPRLTSEPFLAAHTALTAVMFVCAITLWLAPQTALSLGDSPLLVIIGLANVAILVWAIVRSQ